MTFVKLPEKALGATATVNGLQVVCKDFPYEGKQQLKWVYSDNEAPVFRKINGKVQIVSPDFRDGGKTTSNKTVVFPELKQVFEESCKELIEKEEQFTALAVKIAKERYPDLEQSEGTFGMIVNAIKTHL